MISVYAGGLISVPFGVGSGVGSTDVIGGVEGSAPVIGVGIVGVVITEWAMFECDEFADVDAGSAASPKRQVSSSITRTRRRKYCWRFHILARMVRNDGLLYVKNKCFLL